MFITSNQRRIASLSGAVLGISLLAVPAAGASESGETAETTSTPALCTDRDSSTPAHHFGHYGGHSAVPSTTEVTASGIEAQCILWYLSQYNDEIPGPGAVDGIFGPNSQTSMRAFQRWSNDQQEAGLSVDGLPGPASWPYLRGGQHLPG